MEMIDSDVSLFSAGIVEPHPASLNEWMNERMNEWIGWCEKDRWLVDLSSNDKLAMQQSHCHRVSY